MTRAGSKLETSLIVAFQNPNDPLAPYGVADVIEPINGDIVIRGAAGAQAVLDKHNMLGNNDVFKNANFNDPFTLRANAINGGLEGLFPLLIPFTPCAPMCTGLPGDTCEHDDAPWHWFNEQFYELAWNMQTNPPFPGAIAVCRSKLSNPNNAMRARTYIDTVIGYLAPRMQLALKLFPTSIEELRTETRLQVYPNPAREQLRFRASEATPIIGMELYDLTGRQVMDMGKMRSHHFHISVLDLKPGLYLAKTRFEKGVLTEKVIIE